MSATSTATTTAIAAKKTVVPDKWDATQLPSLAGKVAVVTGANSGIGYETALQLARKGADVVLACRSEERGKAALKTLQADLSVHGGAGSVTFEQLDVSSLASVRAFAERFLQTHERLDLLINNAGIMAVPHALSVDGYESQFATNHLGHFALTARLFDLLKKSAASRIVNVSSNAHRQAFSFNEDTIMTSADKYSPIAVYADTKVSNILFTKELDRRLKAAGVEGVTAVVCHPGATASNLTTAPAADNSFFWSLPWKILRLLPWFFQSAQMGALPTLYAAAASNVQGGDYFGPRGLMALWGYPTLEEPTPLAQSESAAKKLWAQSEKLASLTFEVKK
ncbi:Ww domain-containing oxidoreductase [Globisporangium polare]